MQLNYYSKSIIFALLLTLIPWDVYAIAFSRPDPSFPCAIHNCGCATRLKCLTHCCCFPKASNKPLAPAQMAIKSCGSVGDLATLPERREILLPSFSPLSLMQEEHSTSWIRVLYSSHHSDITTPPPEASS